MNFPNEHDIAHFEYYCNYMTLFENFSLNKIIEILSHSKANECFGDLYQKLQLKIHKKKARRWVRQEREEVEKSMRKTWQH